MSPRLWLAASLVAAGTLVPIGTSRVAARPVSPLTGVPEQSTSTLDDQTDLAVTVYNSDIALVRDVRQVQLPRGTFDLQFQDIAATVNPATVHFRSLTEPSRVSVLEQNYEYDLLEPDKLLRKYVGRDVTLVRRRQDGGIIREEEVTARLLSYNSAPVWQINGEIVTGFQADHIRFPELPGNLHVHPTLIWSLDNSGAVRHRVEASYLASHLAWNADYVLTVARDDKSADLDGWVTVTNGSGTAFKNASLQLVAGDLNRVRQVFGQVMNDAKAMAAERSRGADDAGKLLGLPPLHRRPEDVDQQQRDEADQHAECDGVSRAEAVRHRRAGVLLPQRAASRLADQGRRPGLLPAEE